MQHLLIDFGSTRIKWMKISLTDEQNLLDTPLSACFYDDNSAFWQAVHQHDYQGIMLCKNRDSVCSLKLQNWATEQLIPVQTVAVDISLCHVAYAEPNRLGVDRFLGLLAGQFLTSQSFCVISAGTAITVDGYDANTQRHLGGLIQLGLMASVAALRDKTGLPLLDAERMTAMPLQNGNKWPFATSTEEALYLGALTASRATMDLLITSWQAIYPNTPIYLTGGDAERLFDGAVKPWCRRVDNLLFLGMQQYGQRRSRQPDGC